MDDQEDVQLSPVAVVDNDFISNDDITFALQHLHLEELLLLPEEEEICSISTTETNNDDLLRVFDNDDDDDKPPQEANDLEPEFERLAEQFDSLALEDPFLFELSPDDLDPTMFFCQPCDDPDSVPPFSEEDIATAAALLAAEYENMAERENDTFWREQLQILEEETPPQDFASPQEDWKEEEDGAWVPDPIPLPEVAQRREMPRPEAIAAAQPVLGAFAAALWHEEQEEDRSGPKCKSILRQCIGHKERILGCAISPDGKYLATASQDGTVRIWDMASQKIIRVLSGKTKDEEILRVAWCANNYLAMGGADGWVNVFHCDDWSLAASIDHDAHLKPTRTAPGKLEPVLEEEERDGKGNGEIKSNEEQAEDMLGPPQIYSLQFVDEWKALSSAINEDEDSVERVFLLTSADDFVILWELDVTNKKTKTADGSSQLLQPREIFSLRFSEMTAVGYGVSLCNVSRGNIQNVDNSLSASDAFGGVRNPNNIIFVFDASYCPTNGLIGAALSDGTLRLMNGRGVCRSVLSLPGCQSHHLTSFSWDSTGKRLATAVATGHVIVWSVEQLANETIQRSCEAIYHGGHIPGRPVFGARFLQNDELLMTWGSDGRLCLWDGKATDEIDAPLSLLLEIESYPIYGVDISKNCGSNATVVVAGGGSVSGFLGIPVYLQDVSGLTTEQDDTSASKRTKTSKPSSEPSIEEMLVPASLNR